MTRQTLIRTALSVMLAAVTPSTLSAQFDLTWTTIDGGGIVESAGGKFELSGTTGQCDAGAPMSGGIFTLAGGFWPGAISSEPADCDGDFLLDLADYQCFVACMEGPQPKTLASDYCLTLFDFDGNQAIDFFDAAEFATQFDGP